jgi:uncharacterized protein
MRIVVDTNIWVSALIDFESTSETLFQIIGDRQYTILLSETQFDEFRRVSSYSKVKARISRIRAGQFVNGLRKVGLYVDPLPQIDVSSDPHDNYLLAMAEAGSADLLISGDKRDILQLKQHGRTRILTVREFLSATT